MKKQFVHKLHGDGVTDDTAAIQERLDAFLKLDLSPGVYKITSPIIAPEPVNLITLPDLDGVKSVG